MKALFSLGSTRGNKKSLRTDMKKGRFSSPLPDHQPERLLSLAYSASLKVMKLARPWRNTRMETERFLGSD